MLCCSASDLNPQNSCCTVLTPLFKCYLSTITVSMEFSIECEHGFLRKEISYEICQILSLNLNSNLETASHNCFGTALDMLHCDRQ